MKFEIIFPEDGSLASDQIDIFLENLPEGVYWNLIDPAPQQEDGQAKKCQADMYADPPRDCDYPFCGCDPLTNKVMSDLEEMGLLRDKLERSGLAQEPALYGYQYPSGFIVDAQYTSEALAYDAWKTLVDDNHGRIVKLFLAPQPTAEREDYKAKYEELIYQVSKKHPDETRHETALRYIRQAEKIIYHPASAAPTDRAGE